MSEFHIHQPKCKSREIRCYPQKKKKKEWDNAHWCSFYQQNRIIHKIKHQKIPNDRKTPNTTLTGSISVIRPETIKRKSYIKQENSYLSNETSEVKLQIEQAQREFRAGLCNRFSVETSWKFLWLSLSHFWCELFSARKNVKISVFFHDSSRKGRYPLISKL